MSGKARGNEGVEMRNYHYVMIAGFLVVLLFGILRGDFGETWRNGATL